MKKRVLALILSLLMIFSIMPADGIYATGTTENGAVAGTFTISQAGVISGYSDKNVEEIVIPAMVGSIQVTSIAAGAFDENVYTNLKSVAVLGKTVTIGEKAFGYYVSSSERLSGFTVYGVLESTAQAYANSSPFDFIELATEISNITTQQDITKCFVNGDTFNVSVELTSSDSKDIIWESADTSQVTIRSYTIKKNQLGKMIATAQVNVINKTTDTCVIYAKTRSGLSKSMTLTLLKSATDIDFSVDILEKDEEDPEKYNSVVTADNFFSNGKLYVDKGRYISIKADSIGDDGNDPCTGYQQGTSNLEYIGILDDSYLFFAKQTTSGAFINISFTTESGITTKSVSVNILNPSSSLVVKVSNVAINGLTAVEGDVINLTAAISSGSTDTVEWSSSNTDKATIISTGNLTSTITTLGFGTVNITCKIKDAMSEKRTLSVTFPLQIQKKYTYSKIAFVDSGDNPVDKVDLKNPGTYQIYVKDPNANSSEIPNERLTYISSNTSIATVSEDGLVTAKAPGDVKITVRTQSLLSSSLDVRVYQPATSVSLSYKNDTNITSDMLPVGQERTYGVSVLPATAVDTFEWISDDPEALEIVSSSAEELVVRAIKKPEGSSTISVRGTSSPTGLSKTLQINIVDAVHANTIGFNVTGYDRIETDGSGDNVYCIGINKTATVTTNVTPSNFNDAYDFLTDDISSQYATVTPNGLVVSVKAKKIGTMNLTLTTSENKNAVCKFKIISPATELKLNGVASPVINVEKGSTVQLISTVTPSNSTDNVNWTVGNSEIVSLSDNVTPAANGTVTVTGLTKGTTTVTATAQSGVLVTATINVIVPVTALDFNIGDTNVNNGTALAVGDKNSVELKNILPTDTSDKEFTWSSITGKVKVTVDEQNCMKAQIEGVSVGEDTVKVTTESGKTFTFPVNVVIPCTSLTMNGMTSTDVLKGDSVKITSVMKPYNSSEKINWTVSQKGIIELQTPVYSTNSTNTRQCVINVKGIKEGTVVLTATSEYTHFTASVTITVKTRKLANVKTTGISNYTYSGLEIKPATLNLVYNDGSSNIALVVNKDYVIKGYEKNINAGTGYVIVEGQGKYSGEGKIPFTIARKPIKATVTLKSSSFIYSGSTIKPEVVSVVYSGKKLVKGTDYVIDYSKCGAKVGSYSVIIKYTGNYTDTSASNPQDVKYSITKKTVEGVTIKNSKGSVVSSALPSMTYTGTARTQNFSVYDGKTKLVKDVDYKVTFGNNVNASTATSKATVTISGLGNYNSLTRKVITFTIKPASLSTAKLTAITDKVYTGSDIKPVTTAKITLISGSSSKTLSNNRDYVISYSNNKKPGKATYKITGKGNYTSSKSISFYILPKKVVGLKQTSASVSSVKLSWTKNSESVSGYAVYSYNASNRKYTYVASTTKNYYTISKLSSGKNYVYVVRAYKLVGSTKKYGDYSAIANAKTAAKTPGNFTVTTKSATATPKWSAVTGVSKYELSYSINNGKTYTRISTSSTNYFLRNLKTGKTVYFRVRSCTNINGKAYYSAYTSIKKIKIK